VGEKTVLGFELGPPALWGVACVSFWVLVLRLVAGELSWRKACGLRGLGMASPEWQEGTPMGKAVRVVILPPGVEERRRAWSLVATGLPAPYSC
jgi:hypothetical protein